MKRILEKAYKEEQQTKKRLSHRQSAKKKKAALMREKRRKEEEEEASKTAADRLAESRWGLQSARLDAAAARLHSQAAAAQLRRPKSRR